MNGQLTELFTKIQTWSKEIHDQRHKENLQKFDKLFDELKNVTILANDVKWLTWGFRVIYGGIIYYLIRGI